MRPGCFAPALAALVVVGTGLATTLTLVLGMEAMVEAASEAPPPPPAAPVAAAESGMPAADPTEARVAAILGRPLFDAQRRPPAPGASAAAVVAELPRLTGVLVTPIGRMAIFVGPGGGKPVVVEEGGRIASWVVEAIRPAEATLVGPEGRHALRPSFDPKGAEGFGMPAAARPGPVITRSASRGR